MSYVLLKASVDWADEFYCEMFSIWSKEEWEHYKKSVQEEFDYDVNVDFGTNESIEITNYEDWISNIVETEITESEYNFLKKNFGTSYGTGDSYFYILEKLGHN